jgi:hypothetical protein
MRVMTATPATNVGARPTIADLHEPPRRRTKNTVEFHAPTVHRQVPPAGGRVSLPADIPAAMVARDGAATSATTAIGGEIKTMAPSTQLVSAVGGG